MLPDRWKEVSLGSLAEIVGGFAFESKEMVDHKADYQVVKMANLYQGNLNLNRNPSYLQNIEGKHQNFLIRQNDILITLTGTNGKKDYGYTIFINFQPNNLLLNQRIGLIRINDVNIDANYIFYKLKTNEFLDLFFDDAKGGTGNQANVSLTALREISLKCPPLEEQKEIVSIINSWDKCVSKISCLVEEKQKQKNALMQRLLTGKQRFPEFEGQEWKTKKLESFIEERQDQSITQDQHPCLTSSRRGIFLQEEYFSKKVASQNNVGYKIINKGDFTFRSMSDDGLFVFNRQEIIDAGLISPAYGVFYPKENIDSDFLYYFLNSSALRQTLDRVVQGGTRTALKLSTLKKLGVAIPYFPEQKKIAAVLNAADKEIALLTQKLEAYQEQKKGLMQQLLTGKKRVKLDLKERAVA